MSPSDRLHGGQKLDSLQTDTLAFVQVLNVSPEHPAVMLSLRQVQCQRLLLAGPGTALPDPVLEQLHNTVMLNPTNIGAWHVSGQSNHFNTGLVFDYSELVTRF